VNLHAPAPKGDIIVLKVGSASLSADDCKLLKLSNICSLVECICSLKQRGFQVILVTSGAVAVGCQRLGLAGRPESLITKQAVAAIGQSRLMRVYDDLFSAMSQPIAQVLLTRDNLRQRHHYVNALNTLTELLRLGVVPIINENDTVAIDELKVGDNDNLSALVASLVQAKWLFLLTDVAGLYDCDPRSNPRATLLHTVTDIGNLHVSLGSSGSLGTGGMTTKLAAAEIATAAGVHTGILRATELDNIARMMSGELVGTHFTPSAHPLKSHKKFIAHGLRPEGAIVLDQGASDSIVNKKSLFSAGVVGVQGNFAAGASVRLLRQPTMGDAAAPLATNATPAAPASGDESKSARRKKGSPVAAAAPAAGSDAAAPPASSPSSSVGSRGRVWSASEVSGLSELGVCVISYSSDEVLKLAGHHSADFAAILGYEGPSELASRTNIAVHTKATVAAAAAAAATAGGASVPSLPTKPAASVASSATPNAAASSSVSIPPPTLKPSGHKQQQGKSGGTNGSAVPAAAAAVVSSAK
jgi:glutamate 5-kinase